MIATEELSYTVRFYEPGDEESVLRLLTVCLPSATGRWDSPALWRWKHQQNPFGKSYILVAEAGDGAIVGVRALMRWKFATLSGSVGAVRPVDTATHPSFRRLGVFSGLTRQAMDEIKAEGVPLVFNTPNTLSLPGYTKMGWSPIGTVRPLFKLVNPIKAISKIVIAKTRGEHSRTPEELPNSMSVSGLLSYPGLETLLLQDKDLNTDQFCTERCLNYLKWRYQDHVSFAYYALWEEKDGQLEGSMIVRPYETNGLRGLIIEELLLAHAEPKVVARLVGEAVRSYSADLLTAYFNPASSHYRLLRCTGFRRDMRKKVNVVMRELNPLPGSNPQLAQTWGLSMGDLESF